jgi:DNA-binding transcriptional LysR family regulator
MSLLPEQGRLGLDDLRLVVALADAGSLAGAARALGVNHASAWRRLGALEVRLGVRLFDRHRTGYAATPAGEEAIAAAGRLLEELDSLERRLAGQDIRPGGTVRLTTTDTLLPLVVPVLASLRATHPAILVELVTADRFFSLTRRDADIALRPADAAPDGLVARRIGSVATAIYAAPAYLDAHPGDPATLDWLAPEDSLSHLGAARWIAARVAPARIVHRANSLLALAAASRAGLGLAPLPCILGDPDPALRRALPPLPEAETSLWLLTHPDLRHTARIRAVLEALAQHLRTRRAELAGSA